LASGFLCPKTTGVTQPEQVSPQQPPKSRTGTILGILGGLLVVGGIVYWLTKPGPKKAGRPGPIPVVVDTVTSRDISELTRTLGTVTPLRQVSIQPQVDGVLADVFFTEGQMVKAGQLLAQIDDRQYAARVAQARAEKASNEAQLVAAQLTLDRNKKLQAQELIAQQTIDDATAKVAQLKASIAANQAAIAAGQVTLSFARIVSPVDGRVGIRKIDPGNVIRAAGAQELVTVTQVAPISVLYALSQDQLPALSKLRENGTQAVVVAYSQDGKTELARGTLAVIDNSIDTTTGTIRMRAMFDNKDGALWPGQFVTVKMETQVNSNATVISPRAVRRGADGTFVFRVQKGEKGDAVAIVPVELGYEDETLVIVPKGLKVEEVICGYRPARLVARPRRGDGPRSHRAPRSPRPRAGAGA